LHFFFVGQYAFSTQALSKTHLTVTHQMIEWWHDNRLNSLYQLVFINWIDFSNGIKMYFSHFSRLLTLFITLMCNSLTDLFVVERFSTFATSDRSFLFIHGKSLSFCNRRKLSRNVSRYVVVQCPIK
jgi:hypothetical protein